MLYTKKNWYLQFSLCCTCLLVPHESTVIHSYFIPGELKKLRKMFGLKEPAKKKTVKLETSKKLKKLKSKKTKQSDAKIKKVHH